MARMHSGGKGSSGSTRPDVSESPNWSEQDKKLVEGLIVDKEVTFAQLKGLLIDFLRTYFEQEDL
ncbi:MAG: hypothetical protein QF566_03065, partial [Candidatus Thalassarchaeaceae archaeon]|nr:hypothetical protein [Candidatus Thalassarchaeaceae archaeon]